MIETQNRVPCAGKGLLEKIEKNIHERINEIINAGISNAIINALYQRKIILSDVVYGQEFILEQILMRHIQSLRKVGFVNSSYLFREAVNVSWFGGKKRINSRAIRDLLSVRLMQ